MTRNGRLLGESLGFRTNLSQIIFKKTTWTNHSLTTPKTVRIITQSIGNSPKSLQRYLEGTLWNEENLNWSYQSNFVYHIKNITPRYIDHHTRYIRHGWASLLLKVAALLRLGKKYSGATAIRNSMKSAAVLPLPLLLKNLFQPENSTSAFLCKKLISPTTR